MARSKTHRGQGPGGGENRMGGRPCEKPSNHESASPPADASRSFRPAERSRPRQRAERVRGHVQLAQLSQTAPERRPQSSRPPAPSRKRSAHCADRTMRLNASHGMPKSHRSKSMTCKRPPRARYAHCRVRLRRAETPAAVRAAARGPSRRSHGICVARTVLIDRLLCTAFSSRPAPFKGWQSVSRSCPHPCRAREAARPAPTKRPARSRKAQRPTAVR